MTEPEQTPTGPEYGPHNPEPSDVAPPANEPAGAPQAGEPIDRPNADYAGPSDEIERDRDSESVSSSAGSDDDQARVDAAHRGAALGATPAAAEAVDAGEPFDQYAHAELSKTRLASGEAVAI